MVKFFCFIVNVSITTLTDDDVRGWEVVGNSETAATTLTGPSIEDQPPEGVFCHQLFLRVVPKVLACLYSKVRPQRMANLRRRLV
jgi:hypothetical protein